MTVIHYLSLSAITFRLRPVAPGAGYFLCARSARILALFRFDATADCSVAGAAKESPFVRRAFATAQNSLYCRGEMLGAIRGRRPQVVEQVLQQGEGLLNRIRQFNVASDAAVLVDHAMWIARLREHVYGSLRLEPGAVGRADSCRLAHWLRDEKLNMAHLPDYWRCLALHVRFHTCAAQVVDLASHGRRLEAELALAPGGQLRCLSAELVSTFARLRQDCIDREGHAIPAHDFGVCSLDHH